jgi:hypothetical protein
MVQPPSACRARCAAAKRGRRGGAALTQYLLASGRCPDQATFTGSVLPRSPFRRPTSGSSWLDWRPVIGTAPGGSAGQLDYRQTTSPPTGQRGACDARAPLSPSPMSRSLRPAYGSWIAPAQGPGLEPDFAPTLARQSRARQRPQRRSTDASWCSPPRRFRPQHGHAMLSIVPVKRDRRNSTNYVHRYRCCPAAR